MIEVYKNLRPVDILAIGVHPDDIELSSSGTILKHIEYGHSVGIADLTKGELGTRGSAEIRLEESEEAAAVQDVDFRVNLEMKDGFITVDNDHILQIAELIRQTRPKMILANAVDDRHPDHGKAAEIVRKAFFYSGLRKIAISKHEACRANTLYHYIQDKNLMPDICVDVSSVIDKKFEAIACFKTQFSATPGDGPQTPISSARFMEFIKAKMMIFGRTINVNYAEGFNVSRAIGVKDLMSLT